MEKVDEKRKLEEQMMWFLEQAVEVYKKAEPNGKKLTLSWYGAEEDGKETYWVSGQFKDLIMNIKKVGE